MTLAMPPHDSEPFDYESIPVGYYDAVYRRRRGAQSKWHHMKFKRVRMALPDAGTLVDVACGPGTLIGLLPESLSCIGVDISPAQILYAQKTYGTPNHRFQRMTPGRLDLPAGSADVVTAVELIEHLEPPETACLLTEVRRILRPGGKIVVTTPNYGSLWPLVEFILNRTGRVSYQGQHVCKYFSRSLRRLLQSAGFKDVDVEAFLGFAPFSAAIGWDFAETVANFEPHFLQNELGLLLIATASNP